MHFEITPGIAACAMCQQNSQQLVYLFAVTQIKNHLADENTPACPPTIAIHFCRRCGFVQTEQPELAADLPRSIIQSIPYQLQWSDDTLPELARVFLAKAMLEASCDKLSEAAYSALTAADLCDKLLAKSAALWSRQVAADYFQRFFAQQNRLPATKQFMLFQYADLCYQAGLLEKARQLYQVIARQQLDLRQQLQLESLHLLLYGTTTRAATL